MTPTPKLRFVWRDVETGKEQPPLRIRVLQQWFDWDVKYPSQLGEWRDVALETEQ